MLDIDRFYMGQALMLARRGKLTVSPNPMVGCVVVKGGQIIGEGFHQFKGGKHAEIIALSSASTQVVGATVYVTLEPCCYTGATPACTDALIKAEVKKVVIAIMDPNPKVSGKGIKILQLHGIEVKLGILEAEAKALNKIFFHYHIRRRPYVIAKWGMSLDGKTKVAVDDDKAITNHTVKIKVHNLRNRCDAIIVGAKTIINDNPELTVRFSEAMKINQPVRIVISSSGKLPTNARIFNTEKASTFLFTTPKTNIRHLEKLKQQGVKCFIIVNHQLGSIPLRLVLDILVERGITSLLVEGGRQLHHTFFGENLVDEIHSFIAPVIINGYSHKYNIKQFDHCSVKTNSHFTAQLSKGREDINYV